MAFNFVSINSTSYDKYCNDLKIISKKWALLLKKKDMKTIAARLSTTSEHLLLLNSEIIKIPSSQKQTIDTKPLKKIFDLIKDIEQYKFKPDKKKQRKRSTFFSQNQGNLAMLNTLLSEELQKIKREDFELIEPITEDTSFDKDYVFL